MSQILLGAYESNSPTSVNTTIIYKINNKPFIIEQELVEGKHAVYYVGGPFNYGEGERALMFYNNRVDDTLNCYKQTLEWGIEKLEFFCNEIDKYMYSMNMVTIFGSEPKDIVNYMEHCNTFEEYIDECKDDDYEPTGSLEDYFEKYLKLF